MCELIKILEKKREDVLAEYEDNRQKLTALDIGVEGCVRLGRQEVFAQWIEHLTDTIKLLEEQG